MFFKNFRLPLRVVIFFLCATALLFWLALQFFNTSADFRNDLSGIKTSSEVNNTLNDLITASNKLSIAYRFYMVLDSQQGENTYREQRTDIIRLQNKMLFLSRNENWHTEAKALISELESLERQFDTDITSRQVSQDPNLQRIMSNISAEIKILDELNLLEEKLLGQFYAQQQSIFETKDRAVNQWMLLMAAALVVFLTVIYWLGRAMAAADNNAARAETAEADKSRFMNYLVHDLRSPLNSIINFADISQREALGPAHPKYREYAGDIYQAGMHMLQLVNNLLDHAKLRAGMLELKPKPVLPAAEFEQVTHILRGLLEQKKLEIEWAADHGLIAYADPDAVQRMFTNLLSNAIKYSPAGGKITFDLKLEKPANDKPKVRVSIIDQGPGIKHQDLKILGQDFQQGSDSDPQKSLGTGLGLSLVANLAEKQGGQLELRPAPGRGTIASIVFPAAAA